MEKLLLGIDIGTSACKVAIFNLQGNVISQSTKEYKVYYPEPGFVEQNPDEWWESVCMAIKEALSLSKINPDQIAGVGIDGQSWSAIPINKQGEVLCNTPIWMDTRAADICKDTVDRIGFEKIFEISGNSFEPTYSTPKILWFKKNRPDVYNSAYKFLQSNSFIAFRLTGQISQDLSQGYGIHSFNMKEGKWDDCFCEELGFDRAKLPEIYRCHDVIGEVTGIAAAQTGLSKGTPVVAGGLDASCGTLGAGVLKIGQTQEQGGQAGGMSICLNSAVAHPKLILGFHVVPELWLLQGGTVGGGGTIKWFRQELGAFEETEAKAKGLSPFKIMDDEAASVPAGSEGLIFLPYMAGERSPLWDRNAKGVFFGLGYNKTRAHMVRAVLEGCAFALQHNIKTAEEIGVGVNELVAMGGAANSRLWTQIKADVTGKTIKVPTSDTATTLGAAILAGVGTGLYRSFEQAVADTIVITRTHEPDKQAHAKYERNYGIYLELYEKLKDTMQKI
ncbi:MAG TPA: FGGY-family carbohydrate kinase [Ruminiclostridium sp.]|nr:FGGY-family carbohydrate kinase [Ruminiclostridium sp.]